MRKLKLGTVHNDNGANAAVSVNYIEKQTSAKSPPHPPDLNPDELTRVEKVTSTVLDFEHRTSALQEVCTVTIY